MAGPACELGCQTGAGPELVVRQNARRQDRRTGARSETVEILLGVGIQGVTNLNVIYGGTHQHFDH